MRYTVEADQALIEKAQARARSAGTSLDDVVRELITRWAGEDDVAGCAKAFSRLARERSGGSPEGYVFDRDENHQRGQD